MATLRKYQRFPVYYSGTAQFVVSDGAVDARRASGQIGAKATVSIAINTRPHEFIGMRIRNVYAVPQFPLTETAQSYFPTFRDIRTIDVDQDVETDLSQQNLIMKTADQALVTGGPTSGPVVWHPFACPYPFRGGNNVNVTITRTTAYPLVVNDNNEEIEGIFPVAKVVLFGWALVKGRYAQGSPPSTGFPTTEGPDDEDNPFPEYDD